MSLTGFLRPAAGRLTSGTRRSGNMGWWPKYLRVSQPDGLRLGGSEKVMVRDLILVKGDVTRTEWFLAGAPAPHVTTPDNVNMRWLCRDEWESKAEILDRPREIIARRFDRGARCLIGWDETDRRVIYHLWADDKGSHTPWIFRRLEPLDKHLLIFDVWAHPDYRGKNVHWAGAAMSCEEVVRRGLTGICAGLEAHEFLPFATKYASFGLGLITPYASILGFNFFGLKLHFDRPPPEGLCAFSRKLHARYPGTYAEGGNRG